MSCQIIVGISTKKMSEAEEKLAIQIKAMKFPEPVREYKFLGDRKFRFDFAWPEVKLAVEVEGGIWSNGRHIRGQGFKTDCIKYNLAVLNGWKVLRFPPDLIKNGEAIDMIGKAIVLTYPKNYVL